KATRQYLSAKASAQALHATVISRLDYRNGLLFAHPKCQIHRLLMTQNSAA
ncbi:hypothetical protein CAPTEDRAFT_140984, partial [Capitella teleta]